MAPPNPGPPAPAKPCGTCGFGFPGRTFFAYTNTAESLAAFATSAQPEGFVETSVIASSSSSSRNARIVATEAATP